MASVLVSGVADRVAAVSQALRDRGVEPVQVSDLEQLPEVCQQAGEHAFDAYVQLGAPFRVTGETAIQRVWHFYAEGVLARFTALDAVRRSLRPGASVVFVMGTLPPEMANDDDRAARRALTTVLSRAVQADMAPDRLTVRILDASSEPDRIAALALGQLPAPRPLDEQPSDLSPADWRVELMSVVFVQT